jgi:hypothetical protein
MSAISSVAGSMPAELMLAPGAAGQPSAAAGDSEAAVMVQLSGELQEQQASQAALVQIEAETSGMEDGPSQ